MSMQVKNKKKTIALFIISSLLLSSNAYPALVGYMDGQFAVDHGAAAYNIPLRLPLGIAGMQPKLAINYNSNGGGGLLGKGFSLMGLSSITRCPATFSSDGFRGGIYYNEKDRYCLDGKRLIAINGADGGDGTEYRTEIDSRSRIISYGQQGSGPSYWKVWTKSGRLLEYGNTVDAKVEKQGGDSVRVWAVNKISDTVDNNITFSYQENSTTGEHYPIAINYGPNSVQFEYETRSDPFLGYQGGGKISSTQRLSRVAIRTGSTLFIDYLLRYRRESSLSLLEGVTQRDRYGEALPEIKFEWSPNSRDGDFDHWSSTVDLGNAYEFEHKFADIDGNGMADAITFDYMGRGGSTGNFGVAVGLSTDNGPFTVMTEPDCGETHRYDHHLADVDGDGKADWIQIGSIGRVGLATGDGNFDCWTASSSLAGNRRDYSHFFADVDGDGMADWIQVSKTSNMGWVGLATGGGNFEYWTNSSSARGATNNYSHYFADVNGDGMDDWIQVSKTSNMGRVGLATGGGNFEHWSSSSAARGSERYYDHHFADVNGDGMADWIQVSRKSNQAWVGLATGDGNFDHWSKSYSIPGETYETTNYFIDVNRDGMADWIRVNKTDNMGRVGLATGGGNFELWTNSSTSRGRSDGWVHNFADVNGDGTPDWIQAATAATGTGWWNIALSHGGIPESIVKISGSGSEIDLSYKLLTDNSVYSKGSGAGYPEIDVIAPLPVVSQAVISNGIGGANSRSYQYGGAKSDVLGRGSLGFAWIEVTDESTGIITRSEYRQDFPYVGMLSRSEQRSSDGTAIAETSAQYEHVLRHNNKVYDLHVTQSVETSYELDGSLVGSITTDNSDFDEFGNARWISVTTTSDIDSYSKITENDYDNDEGSWFLGQLTRASVTHYHNDGSQQTRTTAYTYDAITGLLDSETVEPLSQKALTTSYEYDSFGNKISVTVSSPGLTPRTTTTQYDTLGRFPVGSSNALNHDETFTYDSVCGQLTSMTGSNNLTTNWSYDSLCRKVGEQRADDTTTRWSYAWNDGSGPIHARYKITETSSGQAPFSVWYDSLGREVRKESVGFDGRAVYEDSVYNALGQLEKQSLPYFQYNISYWVESSYDILGRVIQVRRPGPGGGYATSSTSYQGRTTVKTNALGQIKTTIKNGMDKVMRVEEEEGAWVEYQYDAVGNLVQTNASGVIIDIEYDQFDRKIAMDDPDMGHWSYQHNAYGELVSQTDTKGQTVTMEYDALGRMIRRVETEGISTWIYDTADYGIGKLAEVKGPNGYHQYYNYDSLGRSSDTITEADGKTLTTTTKYDSYSRVSQTIRPEGFVVENVYNQYGYLEAVRTPEALIGDYDALHLTQKWSEIESQLIAELEAAQAHADELAAQAAVYRERATYYWNSAELLREQDLNKGYLDEDRKAVIQRAQQAATDLNDHADRLEQQAAEYQKVADAILSLMPTDWQQSWFINAKARYDQYARDTIAKIEAAYEENEVTLVWVPIDVGGITIFIQAKPGFYGKDAISYQERNHLEEIGNWEAGTAQLLRTLAEDARAQQAARDKYQTALDNHPDLAWVPIDGDGITVIIQVPTAELTPDQVLTDDELSLYNAPDYLEVDGIALAEFYTSRVELQQELQARVEQKRTDYAAVASRLSQTSAAYSAMIAMLQTTTEAQITFWQATGRDAAGRLTSAVVGNGLESQKIYDESTGQLLEIQSGYGYTMPIRSLEYQYDELNNITSRQDHVQGLTENFDYDRLNRLTRSDVNGQIGDVMYSGVVDYAYDVLGNMLSKSDVGAYTYGDQGRTAGNAGPHAFISAGADHTDYQYDLNGSIVQGGSRTIEWASFNKPTRFEKDGRAITFRYDPDRARYLKVTQESRTLYLDKTYERIETGAKVEHKHFIYADGQLVAIHVKSTDDGTALPDETSYLHRDALGSIDTITDGQGNIVERMSYESFGERRAGDWRTDTDFVIPTLTNRGFTGHEHVDEMGLIHMNGRVYDPELGRFLSADPTIQFPYDPQSYNRYSYVLGNPYKYTDPSGYSADEWAIWDIYGGDPNFFGLDWWSQGVGAYSCHASDSGWDWKLSLGVGSQYGLAGTGGGATSLAWEPRETASFMDNMRAIVQNGLETLNGAMRRSRIDAIDDNGRYGFTRENTLPAPQFDRLLYDNPEAGLRAEMVWGFLLGAKGSGFRNVTKGLRGNEEFKAALGQFKKTKFTNAGRAVTKHPEYFGFENTEALRKVYNTEEKINELASDTLKEIMRTGKTTTGAGGRYPNGWKTITAPDGRAASWNADGSFIGFRGVQ